MSEFLKDFELMKTKLKNDQAKNVKALRDLSSNSSLEPAFIGFEDDGNLIESCCKYARDIGLFPVEKYFDRDASLNEMMEDIKRLNEDQGVFALMITRPFLEFSQIKNEKPLLNAVTPSKDVAGLSIGYRSGAEEPYLSISTVISLEAINRSRIDVSGKEVLILLSSEQEMEFESLAQVLKMKKAILTQCILESNHIGGNLRNLSSKADIIIMSQLPFKINSQSLQPKEKILILDFDSESLGSLDLKVSYLFQNILRAMDRSVEGLRTASWNLGLLKLKPLDKVPSDSEISMGQTPKHIATLAKEIGLGSSDIIQMGDSIAKVSLSVLNKYPMRENGKYILVAGINPTPMGEGKSTTTIGLCQALGSQAKKNVMACVRQPSQGPTFGIKGGAAGGGYSQIIPMQEFNLHLTGDIHAVSAANNLLAAQIDARIFHEEDQRVRGKSDGIKGMFSRLVPGKEKKFSQVQLERLSKLGINKTDPTTLTEEEKEKFSFLNIDPSTIIINRVIDINDRMLRKVTIGQSPLEKGRIRETQFDISVASEIMAILSLSADLADMKKRLKDMVVAFNTAGEPVTAHDLGVVEALSALIKDAMKPTLMQTLEGTPVLVHTGPFANIAHGNSSIVADRMALKIVGSDGYVVTESGFGADIGMEKFLNLKCRMSGLFPNTIVIICTIRALKMHGDLEPKSGDALTKHAYVTEDEALLRKGFDNVARHIENALKFGVPVVVCINQFHFDTVKELNLLRELCLNHGANDCVISNHWAKGGLGAKDLADAVVKASKAKGFNFKLLYPNDMSIQSKICTIAKEIYRAGNIEFTPEAEEQIHICESQGYRNYPICIAKTQFSFSADPKLKGAPKDFSFPVKKVVPCVGAGFLVVYAGAISTMPGLPVRPCFYDMVFDTETEKLAGLF